MKTFLAKVFLDVKKNPKKYELTPEELKIIKERDKRIRKSNILIKSKEKK